MDNNIPKEVVVASKIYEAAVKTILSTREEIRKAFRAGYKSRDKEVDELKYVIADFQTIQDGLMEDLQQKDKEIDELKQWLDIKDEEAKELINELQQKDKEVEELKEMLHTCRENDLAASSESINK